jgi:hypothetical protein
LNPPASAVAAFPLFLIAPEAQSQSAPLGSFWLGQLGIISCFSLVGWHRQRVIEQRPNPAQET